uniref:ABSCISIC ACID-INSENSITIVE 5-like protein 2 n=1 Tax=Anthurium amnicola TaxID=1678845 RepID=A0A1D1YFM9_9ARAE
MGIQTMATQGGGGGKQPHFQSLARQGSLYSLTLNEVQNHLGEPLHSMNLDELLRNVLPGEGDQPLAVDLENPSELQRQGSTTLTRALSKRTVDEVWRDIQQGQTKGNGECRLGQERELTLGEMTLEDFLVKAGVVAEDPERKRNGNVGTAGSADLMVVAPGYPQGGQWLQSYHQLPSLQQQQQQAQQSVMTMYAPSHPVPQQLGVGVGSMMEAGYPDAQLSISSPMMGTVSDTQTPGCKRMASRNMPEKTVERKQKRMIKNRESAARSRARKQAYTNELENKVSRLEEENERLKKQKEFEKILYSVPVPEPKFRLRRTSSAPL